MFRRYGRILKTTVTPYHILDIMKDPAYMKHFLLRYQIALEQSKCFGKQTSEWALIYEGNPELLYDDIIDEIKTALSMEKTSAAQLHFRSNSIPMRIALAACSDWITEKTGRMPEFEIFSNAVKSKKMDFRYYRPNEKNKKMDC